VSDLPLVSVDSQAIARRYLTPRGDSFWHWADDGMAIAWTDGSTIIFRPQLEQILSRLATAGLPPLDPLLLLMAATRDAWGDSSGMRGALAGYLRYLIFPPRKKTENPRLPTAGEEKLDVESNAKIGHTIPQDRVRADAEYLIERLDAIGHLPSALRSSTLSKSVLAEMVFEAVTNRLSPEESSAVMTALAQGVSFEAIEENIGSAEADPLIRATKDLVEFCLGLATVTPERLELRAQAGLDQLPQTADAEFSPGERVRAMLAELRDDPELGGVARLATNLMAAVAVPKKLDRHDELSLGGLSDLTNRGPLDRLLVSELAHDDETLSIRVAMNEALYLRRESPPRNPPRRRAILLDSGIRLWGVPRMFAVAAALALIATADSDCEIFCFRAKRDGIVPVDLTHRAGLVSHLAALQPQPHPGAALPAFFAAVKEITGDTCETLLVTHADVLADRDFVKAADAEEALEWNIVAVARSGQLRLWKRSIAGQRLLSEATLDLREIAESAEPSRPMTPLVGKVDPGLPIILSTRPFPLLLPKAVEPHHAATSDAWGLVAVTKDGRLMHWPVDHRGGRQLTSSVPRGRVCGVFLSDRHPVTTVVVQAIHSAQIIMLACNLSTGKCASVTLGSAETQTVEVAQHGDLLLVISRTSIQAFDSTTGQFVAKLPLLIGTTHSQGRFFRINNLMYALAHDGVRLLLEKVPVTSPSAMQLFERPGIDGPLALLRNGKIEVCALKSTLDYAAPFSVIKRVICISGNGNRIVVSSWLGSEPANFLLDLGGADKAWRKITGDPHEAILAPQIHRSTRSFTTVRHNFQGIWARPNGELALLNKKDRVTAIKLVENQMQLVPRGKPEPSDGKPIRFAPAAGPVGTRYELGVATWKDGSKAYLDSRGMLHLKSSDPQLAEITLVLSNGPMAGWASDFERFGDAYFFDNAATSDAAKFAAAIRAFTARLR
jgi:hypothetical protein